MTFKDEPEYREPAEGIMDCAGFDNPTGPFEDVAFTRAEADLRELSMG